MKKDKKIIPVVIEERIFIIRGKKVMIDAHLAELYQVTTKHLNQQVKRNLKRFPADFMFQLTINEKDEVVTICDHLANLKFSHKLPYAFTEHGVAMLSSVLRSDRAVQMSVFIVRAFVKLHELLLTNMELAKKFNELERTQKEQGQQISTINSVVTQLINPPKDPAGFRFD
ncbi:MAG: ORF6N domain-containing protein [Patescibacteria group bacterium]